jgi:hypothetical protein
MVELFYSLDPSPNRVPFSRVKKCTPMNYNKFQNTFFTILHTWWRNVLPPSSSRQYAPPISDLQYPKRRNTTNIYKLSPKYTVSIIIGLKSLVLCGNIFSSFGHNEVLVWYDTVSRRFEKSGHSYALKIYEDLISELCRSRLVCAVK